MTKKPTETPTLKERLEAKGYNVLRSRRSEF